MTFKQENGHYLIDKKTGISLSLGTLGLILWLGFLVSSDRAIAQQTIKQNTERIQEMKEDYYRKEEAQIELRYIRSQMNEMKATMSRIEEKLNK